MTPSPRSFDLRRGPVDPAVWHGGEGRVTVVSANILQPLIDIANAVLVFFHDNAGLSWGASIIALTSSPGRC